MINQYDQNHKVNVFLNPCCRRFIRRFSLKIQHLYSFDLPVGYSNICMAAIICPSIPTNSLTHFSLLERVDQVKMLARNASRKKGWLFQATSLESYFTNKRGEESENPSPLSMQKKGTIMKLLISLIRKFQFLTYCNFLSSPNRPANPRLRYPAS